MFFYRFSFGRPPRGTTMKKTVPEQLRKNGPRKNIEKRFREGLVQGLIDFDRFLCFCKGILIGKLGAVNLWKSGPPATPGEGTCGAQKTMKKRSRMSENNYEKPVPKKTFAKRCHSFFLN